MNIKYFDNFEGLWLDVTGTVGSSLVITNNGFEALQTNKMYIVELTQSASSDPTIDFEYFNNIGTIVWTRTSAGNYNGYCLNAFIGNIPTETRPFINTSYGANVLYYEISKIDNDNVLLKSMDRSTTPYDDMLKTTTIKISIY